MKKTALAIATLAAFIGAILAVDFLGPMPTIDAQVSSPSIIIVASSPAGNSCTNNLPDKQVATTGALFTCASGVETQVGGSGGMVYPSAGVAVSTGSSWATSITQALIALTNTANTFTAAQTAPAFNLQSKSAGPYAAYFEDFYSAPTNAFATNSIGSPSSDTCAVSSTVEDQNHPGNIALVSGNGTSGTGLDCIVGGGAQIVTADSSLGWTWESAVYPSVLPGTTASSYQAGMVTTQNVSPWTTGIEFYLSSANGTANDWYCRYASTSVDTGVAATVAWHRLTIASNGTTVSWFIDGAATAAGCTGVAVASMPSTVQTVGAWTSVTNTSSTSVSLYVDYTLFQRAVTR